VVEAVKTGKFRVYAVSTIDEGIEVLTGVSAGVRDGAGKYTEGSVNDRVEQKLRQFTERQKKIAATLNSQTNSTTIAD
jgi:predicted ATP-dependent protease